MLALFGACGFEPKVPETRWTLNRDYIEEENDLLASDPAGLARLDGALQFVAGTPEAPTLLALPEWLDEGFYPNFWGYDVVFGDEELHARLVESNRQAYDEQLRAIAEGRFEDVEPPRYAPDLWRRWQEHLEEQPEDPDATFVDDLTWREEAVRLFEEYYPEPRAAAELYRQQCFHCHGAEGGGDGPTAPYLDPRPRDYRHGVFKFTAVGKNRPRHEDLFRVLTEGIYTTAMPSFRRFTDAQLHALVDYVRLLAIRGETEILMATDFDPDDGIHFENLEENYRLVVDRWREAPEALIAFEGDVPEPTPERIAHGRELFLSETGANCVKCHGPGGRGDGPSVSEPENSTDDWGYTVLPRDLTRGVFRFGRRPIDLYRRIHAGISGTPMPAHYGMVITEEDGTQRPLDEDDVWDLVHFVRSLSEEREPQEQRPAGSAGH